MSNHSSTVLAIDPGSRELGIAVLRGGELLFYGVKTVNNRKSPQMILETISHHIRNLIKKYRPSHLTIKKIVFKQNSYALLAVAAEQIKATAEETNLPVDEYSPVNIRKRLCQTGRATRRATAAILAERFPELKRFYLRTTKWECDYYGNLFDAVAVAVICEEDLAESEQLKSNPTNHLLTRILWQ